MRIVEYMMPFKTTLSMSFHTHVVHHGYNIIVSETKDAELQYGSQEALTFLADESWKVIDYTSICAGHDTPDVLNQLERYTSDDIKGYSEPYGESLW
ncbi:hypothetical protein CMI47_19405 [Candidatus Pacearchaeota archaeon]|nr:hypothetical protein [Candidatus Pacearchaeota archaeon]|tara:strand:+ start:2803 stop:3093 length:291 start_codon:yes stop_codon:yes gene_type:complete